MHCDTTRLWAEAHAAMGRAKQENGALSPVFTVIWSRSVRYEGTGVEFCQSQSIGSGIGSGTFSDFTSGCC